MGDDPAGRSGWELNGAGVVPLHEGLLLAQVRLRFRGRGRDVRDCVCDHVSLPAHGEDRRGGVLRADRGVKHDERWCDWHRDGFPGQEGNGARGHGRRSGIAVRLAAVLRDPCLHSNPLRRAVVSSNVLLMSVFLIYLEPLR